MKRRFQKIALSLTTLLGLSVSTSANAQLRPMIYEDITVNAPVSDVWTDWTTAAGLTTFFAKEAHVELRQGGPYQLYFAPNAPEGSKGNDAGEVLGWQTERMLNVTWAMPPYMPNIRPHLTVLQLEFVPLSAEVTQVRLFHTGFGQGKAWDEGRAYFEKVWPKVLTDYRIEVEK